MKFLNEFTKKRIRKIMEESSDPSQVIQQVEQMIPLDECEDQQDVIKFILETWFKIPREDLHGMTPQQIMDMVNPSQVFDSEGNFSLEKTLDMVNSQMTDVQEFISEYLRNEIKQSEENINNFQFDLEKYIKDIENTPIIKDLKNYITVIERQKGQKIPLTPSFYIKPSIVKEMYDALKDSPYYITDQVPRNQRDAPYIEYLTEILDVADYLKGEKRYISLNQDARKFMKGENLHKHFERLFKAWWTQTVWQTRLNPDLPIDAVDFCDNENIFLAIFLSALSLSSDTTDTFIPLLLFRVPPDMLNEEPPYVILATLEKILTMSYKGFFDQMELWGLIERKKDETTGLTQETLTNLGKYILLNLYQQYTPLNRIEALIVSVRIIILYYETALKSLYTPQEIEQLPSMNLFNDIDRNIEEHFMALSLHLQEGELEKEEIEKFEQEMNRISTQMIQFLKTLKEQIQYPNRLKNRINNRLLIF